LIDSKFCPPLREFARLTIGVIRIERECHRQATIDFLMQFCSALPVWSAE
jgi:hypothetical protein